MSDRLRQESVITYISELVEDACKQDTNIFGYGIWTHHLISVLRYGTQLAEQLGADVEIVQLAALLHDYAGIKHEEWISEHHIHGARLAGDILRDVDFPPAKIEAVQHCIVSHRGSKNISRETLEANILASADAMAHFAHVPSLLHLAYVRREMGVEEGTQWLLGKLERSWNKLMPEAQAMIHKRYNAIKLTLSNGGS